LADTHRNSNVTDKLRLMIDGQEVNKYCWAHYVCEWVCFNVTLDILRRRIYSRSELQW